MNIRSAFRFPIPASKLKNEGAPVEIILPKEGLGWEMEATAIMKGTRHMKAAQALADFAASAEANKLYNDSYQVLARKDVSPTCRRTIRRTKRN